MSKAHWYSAAQHPARLGNCNGRKSSAGATVASDGGSSGLKQLREGTYAARLAAATAADSGEGVGGLKTAYREYGKPRSAAARQHRLAAVSTDNRASLLG